MLPCLATICHFFFIFVQCRSRQRVSAKLVIPMYLLCYVHNATQESARDSRNRHLYSDDELPTQIFLVLVCVTTHFLLCVFWTGRQWSVLLPQFLLTILQLTDHGSDMDEPMASQSADSEAPLTHNSSKNNFFAMEEQQGMLQGATASNARGSFKV